MDQLTGPRRGVYLIRDNIFNVLENELVRLLEDIFMTIYKEMCHARNLAIIKLKTC